MNIPPLAQQMIQINEQTAKTQQDIATAVAVKAQNVSKQQGEAVVELINAAANTAPAGHGIDVRA